MTTIAYKDGVMACDSCWSENESVDTLQKKIYRLKCGALLGQAGDNDSRDVVALFDKLRGPSHLPSRGELLALRSDFGGLLAFPNGRIFKISTTHIAPEHWSGSEGDVGMWEVNMPFAALGSGKEVALGAMAAGKTSPQAVAIACRFDLYSRPPVHTMILQKKARRDKVA